MDYHISETMAWAIGILAVWELAWKGFGLWRAARQEQLVWYVAMLVINTAGLLPIVYLLLNRNKKR